MKPTQWSWQSACRCHTGNRRRVNEDACLMRPDLGLWVVADGMGGHTAGDFASQTITGELDRLTAVDGFSPFIDRTEAAIHSANRLIQAESVRRGNQTIGSTVAALLSQGGRCACIWVGDSRIYLFRDDQLVQLSHDHSLAQEQVDLGQLTPDQAELSPGANVLTRAVGVREGLAVEVETIDPRADDLFLLCSDGLTKELSVSDIAGRLRPAGDLEAQAEDLLQTALARGGRDNVTLILVRFQPATTP